MANADLDAPRSIIAVMGITGTGKSSFIKLITGDENIVVGHDPESATRDIRAHSYFDKRTGHTVDLVDTPGFDDSQLSDAEILQKVSQFLQPEVKLNGVIYMHRISDVRVGGMAKNNLRVFKGICGDKLSNVRIVTTNWDHVKEEGPRRERALADGPFRPFIDAGAVMMRHDNNLTSAMAIMADLVGKPAAPLQIQNELNAGKTLAQTSAGAIVMTGLDEMKKKHEREMADLKMEMARVMESRDEKLRAELDKEIKELRETVALIRAKAAQLQETDAEDLRQQLQKAREDNQRLRGYANAGNVERWVRDVRGVTWKGWKMGGVAGAAAGLAVAPVVATKRALVGR